MITTTFENMNDFNLPVVTLVMPAPVRVDDEIEINGTTWKVKTVSWIIEADPKNASVSLHVRIR